jgi:hypothetical protein
MRFMVVIGLLFALAASSAAAEAMTGYQWKKRPFLVFAPSADSALTAQRAIVGANRSGFAERDMVIIYVAGTNVETELGPAPGMDADALRRRYNVLPSAFKAVLVGKDGGVKMTSGSPIAARILFGAIDAMPMRADEIRRKK